MTVYERLCAYVSPSWYGYRSILDLKNDLCEARIERSLPLSAEDSYLGRLVGLSVHLNYSLTAITAGNLEAWCYIFNIITRSEVIFHRPLTSKMKLQLKEYLAAGFPAEWILNLLTVFSLEMYTAKEYKPLNKVEYLECIKATYAIRNTFEPVARWFEEHPGATKEETEYEEV